MWNVCMSEAETEVRSRGLSMAQQVKVLACLQDRGLKDIPLRTFPGGNDSSKLYSDLHTHARAHWSPLPTNKCNKKEIKANTEKQSLFNAIYFLAPMYALLAAP